MSSADKKEEQKASARMKTYFIIALLLLFLMAFLSSLGNTFLYILGGLSFFFSFLAWQNWRATLRAEDFTHYNRSERGNSFTDTIILLIEWRLWIFVMPKKCSGSGINSWKRASSTPATH